MQRDYYPGPSQCEANFKNFYRTEKYAKVRKQILKKMLLKNSKDQFYIIALIT